MKTIAKKFGSYIKLTFDKPLVGVNPGQCVTLDGKWFAVYDSDHIGFSILVKDDSYFVDNDPKEIVGPVGKGFTSCLHKRAIVVAGGTGIGAIVPVIRARNKYGLSTDVLFYSRGDISSIRADQATIGMCRNVIFWDTLEKGRPANPLTPLYDRPLDAFIYVAGPKSLVEATQKASADINYICYVNT